MKTTNLNIEAAKSHFEKVTGTLLTRGESGIEIGAMEHEEFGNFVEFIMDPNLIPELSLFSLVLVAYENGTVEFSFDANYFLKPMHYSEVTKDHFLEFINTLRESYVYED